MCLRIPLVSLSAPPRLLGLHIWKANLKGFQPVFLCLFSEPCWSVWLCWGPCFKALEVSLPCRHAVYTGGPPTRHLRGLPALRGEGIELQRLLLSSQGRAGCPPRGLGSASVSSCLCWFILRSQEQCGGGGVDISGFISLARLLFTGGPILLGSSWDPAPSILS